jgi:hypothetical protein
MQLLVIGVVSCRGDHDNQHCDDQGLIKHHLNVAPVISIEASIVQCVVKTRITIKCLFSVELQKSDYFQKPFQQQNISNESNSFHRNNALMTVLLLSFLFL